MMRRSIPWLAGLCLLLAMPATVQSQPPLQSQTLPLQPQQPEAPTSCEPRIWCQIIGSPLQPGAPTTPIKTLKIPDTTGKKAPNSVFDPGPFDRSQLRIPQG
jgi:hypothetical protein